MWPLHCSAFPGMVLIYCPGFNYYVYVNDSEISVLSHDLFSEPQTYITWVNTHPKTFKMFKHVLIGFTLLVISLIVPSVFWISVNKATIYIVI